MQQQRLAAFGVFMAIWGFGCRHTSGAVSRPREAPDASNQPLRLGIAPPYRWADVKDLTAGSIAKPWSDTYWPLAERGLAARWAALPEARIVSPDPFSLADVVQSLQEAAKGKSPMDTVYLSPAEKYDLMAGNLSGMNAELTQSLATFKKSIDASAKPKILGLQAAMSQLRASAFALDNQRANMSLRLAALQLAIEKARTAHDKATVDKLSTEATTLTSALQQTLTRLSEVDDQFKTAARSSRELRRPFDDQELLLARSLASYLPMTAESWATWDAMERGSIEDYSWMGHCHGWAPASLSEPTPRHAVLASRGSRRVLFTEGDIRGLLTKVWAEQAPPAKFAARRCNTENPEVDSKHRVLDGRLCLGEDCDADQGGSIYIKNNKADYGYIEFRSALTDATTKFARLMRNLDNDAYSVQVFDSAEAMAANIENPDAQPPPQFGTLHLLIGCRDVNPMTLHLALTSLIHNKKQGFVFDREQASQVWNQPVFAYKFDYLPIKLKTPGKVAEPGSPVAISDLDDPLKDFRAPGTAYLVSVLARIEYGVEHGPLLAYAPGGGDELTQTLVTVYTLELDANLNIIGGEWGRVARADGESFEIASEQPDFLWYQEPNATLATLPFDVTMVHKLASCAQATPTGKMTLQDATADDPKKTVEVAYADCPL